ERWDRLNRDVGGQLVRVQSPLAACAGAPQSEACASLFRSLKNPYFIGDDPALTQSLGWADAWTSQPSVYAVAARRTEDVVAAVKFARAHNLRVVVKGGGHSYHGTSNAPDSLLIWTRRMNAITPHDAFVPSGCAGTVTPQPAVSLGAGVVWAHAYDAVTTGAGRYVQGGGCGTVGVAGLIQSGGFGSFSKRYGMAAASLLEAEIVTADGAVRLANACTNPDLFWSLKGGGGGSLGVVTRLTLRTHDLPAFFGPVFMTIRAASDAAYQRLIERVVRFYAEALFNPHWGEQIVFRPDNTLIVRMLFQGLDEQQAQAVWRPFLDWIAASPDDFRLEQPMIAAVPARHFWDPSFMRNLTGVLGFDDRPGASDRNVFWAGDAGETGQFLHAYQSAWLPATLLRLDWQQRLAEALFAATRHWSFSLHFNKGLAGAPEAAVAAARDTATNPAICDAFALAICAASQQPAYPSIAGREPDLPAARRRAAAVSAAMDALRTLMPAPAAYVSESDFFEADWQQAYWGANYARLRGVKDKYDPDGLFFVHHGVGSERWSADGFTRVR
ncbi:MAG TPA: FAD-binding oxidoreductase, partial [Alphaproteobacteria bacterium]|nr:FAD-binding oxidoreductase [Alphaproteobacteria bacterium]